jgi:16S rRNA processing protein RimM
LAKTQGRRGEIAADLLTDFPELFAERKRIVALDPAGRRRELALEDFWPHKGRIVLKFAGVDSISDAEALLGCEIQIPASERAELEPGEVYISDLRGCVVAVVETAGEGASPAERVIGQVADVMFGAGEAPLLVVREGKKEYLIPFADEYVKSLDLGAKRITLSLPDGMLELDAPVSKREKQQQQAKREE